MSRTLPLLVYLIFTTNLWGDSTHFHFVGKDSETQSISLAQGSWLRFSWDIFKSESSWLLSPVICFTPRLACVIMERALSVKAVIKVLQKWNGEGFEDKPHRGRGWMGLEEEICTGVNEPESQPQLSRPHTHDHLSPLSLTFRIHNHGPKACLSGIL